MGNENHVHGNKFHKGSVANVISVGPHLLAMWFLCRQGLLVLTLQELGSRLLWSWMVRDHLTKILPCVEPATTEAGAEGGVVENITGLILLKLWDSALSMPQPQAGWVPLPSRNTHLFLWGNWIQMKAVKVLLIACCGRTVHAMLWEQTKRKHNCAGDQSQAVMGWFFSL